MPSPNPQKAESAFDLEDLRFDHYFGCTPSGATERASNRTYRHPIWIWQGHLPFRRMIRGAEELKRGPLEHSVLLRLDRGMLRLHFNANTIVLNAGDMIAFSAFSAWSIEATDDFDATWVGLPAWWLHQRVLTMGLASLGSPVRGGTMMAQALNIVLDQLLAEPSDETSLAIETFCDLLARWLVSLGPSMANRGRIDLILDYIVANFSNEQVTPAGAAQAIGCSVRAIHHACAAHGTTFGNLLLYTRISIAAYKLSYKAARISPVAFECGFSSLSHFSHAFKAQYGMTARDFRNSYRSAAKV